MVLYVSNSFSSSIEKSINLLILSLSLSLTYPLILSNIKTNGFVTLSKYPSKYLEFGRVRVFISTNFEMNNITNINTPNSYKFFCATNSFAIFLSPNRNIIILSKK